MIQVPDPPGLRILLSFLRTTESGDPFGFQFGPQDYVLPTEQGETPSAHFSWDDGLLSDLQALRRPGRDPMVIQRIGEKLRRFVWDAGWSKYEPQIRAAVERREPVTITLRSSAAELYALPWELLTLRTGQSLGECDSVLLRFEWPDNPARAEEPSPRPEGGRILFAWSAAGGSVPVAEHIKAISAATKQGGCDFDEKRDVVAHASLDQIVNALSSAQRGTEPIAILHILCHGTEIGTTYGLLLDGEDEPASVDAAQLRSQLAPFASMVRLVVLSACDSGNGGAIGGQLGSVAQTLHRCGFLSVIASRYPLSVAGSVVFAKSFYSKLLGVPSSVEAAFLSVRRKLQQSESAVPQDQRTLDWGSFQLYARHSDGEQTRPIVFRPYRGLLAFQPEHARFFFGREPETEEILSDLQSLVDSDKPRLLIVAGGSGTGKSSLVFAGAIPKLLAADPDLRFLRMRPGADPLKALSETLAQVPAQGKGILVVDQFEELFTQTKSPPVRESFVRQLWSLAAAPDPGLRILLTMRVDYVGRCGELLVSDAGLRLDRVAYDEAHRIFIAQMSPEQLHRAIVQPAQKVGLQLQEGLAERMLLDVGREPGALPLLQDAVDTLWQHRQGNTLTQTAYDALGGVVGSLQNRADAVAEKIIRSGSEEVLRRIFLSLVAVSEDTALDSRARVRRAALFAGQTEEERGRFEQVLQDLVAGRLLTEDGDAQEFTIEVAHEALIRKWPRLRAWIDEDRAGLVQKRRIGLAAQQWQSAQRDESLLLRGLQLANAVEWRKTWDARIGESERAFLDASAALQDRQQQLRRQQELKEKESSALILRLLLDSYVEQGHRLLAEGRDEEALLWLLRAYQQGSKSRALPYLLRRGMRVVDARIAAFQSTLVGRLCFVAESPLGDVLVIADQAGRAHIISAKTGETVHALDGQFGTPAGFDSSGGLFLFCGESGSPVFDVETGLISFVIPRSLDRASFCPAKNGWVALTKEGALACFAETSGDRLFEIPFPEEQGKILCWSEDGSSVLAQMSTGSLQVLALPDLRCLAQLSVGADRPWHAAFDSSGQRLLIFGEIANEQHGGELKHYLSVFDVPSGTRLCRIVDLAHLPVTSACFSPDGKYVLACREWQAAEIYDVASGRVVSALRGHIGTINGLTIADGGRKVITVSDDSCVRVFDSQIPSPISTMSIPDPNPAGEVADWGMRSLDGRYELRFGEGSALLVVRPDTSETITSLSGLPRQITFIKFSPDGRWLVTTGSDGTARLWTSENCRPHLTLTRHSDLVTHAAFSEDSQRLLTASVDGTVRLHDIETGFHLATISVAPAEATMSYFGPDGSVITQSSDGRLRVWDVTPERRSPAELSAQIERRGLLRFESPESRTMVVKDWRSPRLNEPV